MTWLSGWQSRKSHNLNGQNGAGTDYAIAIKVNKTGVSFDANINNALFYSTNRPRAVYYAGTYHRTYFAYSDDTNAGSETPDDDIYVNYFDHDTKTFGTPVKVRDDIAADFHGSPTIQVDSNGRLHVFYSCHNDPYVYYKRTINPEDISTWTDEVDICPDTEASFCPSVMLSNNHMAVLWRALVAKRNRLTRSTDGGQNWATPVTIVDFSGYADSAAYGFIVKANNSDRIHLTSMCYDTVTSKCKFIIYAYSDDEGVNWKRADGSSITLPMTEVNMTAANYGRCVDTADHDLDGGQYAMDDDSNGNIYIIYKKIITSTNNEFYCARWTGSAWSRDSIVSGVPMYIGDIRVISPTEVYAFLDVNYCLKKYKWNGTSWSFVVTIETGANPNGSSSPHLVEQQTDFHCIYQWGVVSGFDTNIHFYIQGLNATPDGTTTYFGLTVGNVYCLTANDDFSDIRFTDDDGITVLYQWLMEKVNGEWAVFYVKVNDNLNSNQSIYIYWKKTDASESSDIVNTFPSFADDFELNNFTRWTANESNGWTIDTNVVKERTYSAKASTADKALYKQHGLGTTLRIIEYWIYTVTTNTTTLLAYMYDRVDSTHAPNVYMRDNDFYYLTGTVTWNKLCDYTISTWYRIRVIITSSTTVDYYVYNTAGGLVGSAIGKAMRTYDNTKELQFIADDAINYNIDAVFIRKYVSPEPTHGSWGAEETAPPSTQLCTQTLTFSIVRTSKLDKILIQSFNIGSVFDKALSFKRVLNQSLLFLDAKRIRIQKFIYEELEALSLLGIPRTVELIESILFIDRLLKGPGEIALELYYVNLSIKRGLYEVYKKLKNAYKVRIGR